jgi:ferric-dicitrate binding protein FerR (iron transport regulator)
MVNENQIELLVTACLTGKAIPEEQKRLATWIQESPEHLRYCQDFVNIWQVTHPAFDPDGIDVVNAGIRLREKIAKTGLVKKLWIYWQRIAAVILVPLLLLSVYLYLDSRQADVPESVEYQELKSPHGMYSKVDLPDGTGVWLQGGSVLKYPLKFRPGQRRVFLEGEGYFEVHSDSKNPFVVETNRMTLTATGTEFNIQAYAADSITAVTMKDGMVDVLFEQSSSVTLKPGERALYNSQSHRKTVVKTDDPYKWYAWKDGLMIFRDDPLCEVFKQLEQRFNVEIILKDRTIAGELYRATFEEESLDDILQLLKMSAPIRFVRNKRTVNADHRHEKQRIEVYKQRFRNGSRASPKVKNEAG